MMKLVVTAENSEIRAVQVLDILSYSIESTLVGIDDNAYAQLQEQWGGERVQESEFYAQVGIYEERMVIVDTSGTESIRAPDVLLLELPRTLVDLLRTWQSGKYIILGGEIELNPKWEPPTIYIERVGENAGDLSPLAEPDLKSVRRKKGTKTK